MNDHDETKKFVNLFVKYFWLNIYTMTHQYIPRTVDATICGGVVINQ